MPSLIEALKDREFLKSVYQGLTDAANRGMVAGTLGAPVDMATQAANLGIAGAGYLGHKAGVFKTAPELIDSRNVPGSSEWIGQKMQNAGMVSANRNPVAEMGMGLLSPVAFKAAQKAGGLLANAEMKAAENAAKPSTLRQAGQRGIFAGEWAQTADKAKLKAAQEMETKQADPRDIWSQTGWFKGPDGKWRFEIDDSGADVPMFKKHWLRPLEESIVHDPLEAAYPDVKNIMFEASPGGSLSGAQYSPKVKFHNFGEREAILIRNSDESLNQNKSLALHELQHAIQGREGFAKGGSPESVRADALDMLRRDVASGAIASTEQAMEMLPMAQNNAYMRLMGEVEARAVQSRMNLSAEQRRALFPLDSYDVPLDSLIIKY